ncbi:hypothetical protein BMS3Bbin06_00977 [bacterium BMS3Bbin06]|nr:hypothetical protein BMS3Bbin06_00977 [bacterium BMS3Bbin06]
MCSKICSDKLIVGPDLNKELQVLQGKFRLEHITLRFPRRYQGYASLTDPVIPFDFACKGGLDQRDDPEDAVDIPLYRAVPVFYGKVCGNTGTTLEQVYNRGNRIGTAAPNLIKRLHHRFAGVLTDLLTDGSPVGLQRIDPRYNPSPVNPVYGPEPPEALVDGRCNHVKQIPVKLPGTEVTLEMLRKGFHGKDPCPDCLAQTDLRGLKGGKKRPPQQLLLVFLPGVPERRKEDGGEEKDKQREGPLYQG